MKKGIKQKIKMEHIDRLSRGKKSGINIGSQRIGHHLSKFEREIYERSLKKGFLDIDERSRENLFNLWEKVAIAKNWKNIILVKSHDRTSAITYIDGVQVFKGELGEAKKIVKKEFENKPK